MSSRTDGDDDRFPPVSWEEVRDHLVGRLLMDEDWIVDRPDHLVWWPTPLPVSISVIDEGTFPDSTENWIRVSASTRVAVVEELLGRELASDFNTRYPVGALCYIDDSLYLTTVYAFNPRNRSLLAWFYQAILIQASTALDLAAELMQLEGVELPSLPHPVSGERQDVDELVRIYGVEQLNFTVDDGVEDRFEMIRPLIADAFLSNGYQRGFSNEEVDFFNLGFAADDPLPLQQGAFDFALGFMRGTDLERRLGPSLRIAARILPPGSFFDAEQVTYANEALCNIVGTSLFGHVSGPESPDAGSSLWATVPHLTLAEWSNLGPEAFRDSVINSVHHVTAAAQVLRRDVLGISWP